MKNRFQADADLTHHIVLAVSRREPGIDFQTATVARLAGLNDLEVLQLCAREGRILVSHDSRTMPHHFGTLVQEQDSPGVIIVSQRLPISQVVEDLLLIWHLTDTTEWVNRIRYLPL